MTDEMPEEHLRVEKSLRGFAHLPPIPSRYGGDILVYESSSAEVPSIWLLATAPANLNRPDGPSVEAPMHLGVDDAWRLAEQIVLLCRNHYQSEPGNPVIAALATAQRAGVAEGWQQAMNAVGDAPLDDGTCRRVGEFLHHARLASMHREGTS